MRTWVGVFAAFFIWINLWGCTPHRGVYHTVEPGQTLYRISRAYGVDEKNLARLNGIDDPTQLRVGQRIFIPGVSQEKKVAATTAPPAASPVTTARPPSPVTPPPSAPPASAPRPTTSPPKTSPPPTSSPPAVSAAPRTPPSASSIGKGHFSWPLQGQVVRRFGQKNSGPGQGIEIAAGKGTPVRSAAAGRVIYSGDGVRGYGNLIILRHDDNFFTVYAYNERNLVKDGTFVGKGEQIAAVGTPPGGGAPRLYFEVRQGKETVDPLFYLP